MVRLSEREAFDAMREFLLRHHDRAGADDIGGLLGDLEPMMDGLPADGATYEEWRECVAFVHDRRSHEDAAE